ncbi:ribosome silencing factor [Gaoshiqia sp. Z1-71]|uniref:ribosome silencing factor n=1 Tax=Gaoshiqia hydrogeniformans TaxID=3290090 RepID=UPI003BF8D936
MSKTQKERDAEELVNAIIEGIDRKKGLDIVKIDLTKINHSECNYFIICHGNSSTHVDAIAQSVEDTVAELTGEKAWHKDGYKNAIWILLDYADIMVHVFQREARSFYDLETLWADAAVEEINVENLK